MPAPPTLLASALLALGTAVGFLVVARLVGDRSSRATAARLFTLFWVGMALIWSLQGFVSLAGYVGFADFALVATADDAVGALYCLVAACLLYYVLYLFVGRSAIVWPVLAYYFALYLALRYQVNDTPRVGIEVTAWQVNILFATPLQDAGYAAVVALIAGPILAAVAAYGSLFFRVSDAATRYRIACIATGLLVWVVVEASAFATGLAATAEGELARRLVALLSTLAIAAAYRPPRFARERWGAGTPAS